MQTPGLDHIILTVSNTERSGAFYGDLLGFEITVIQGDPEKSFFFECGGVKFFFFPSHQPTSHDRFSEFRIGLDHRSFAAPSMDALRDLAEKLILAGVGTKGVEQFVHTYQTGTSLFANPIISNWNTGCPEHNYVHPLETS